MSEYRLQVFKHVRQVLDDKPAGGLVSKTAKEHTARLRSIKGMAMPGTMFPWPYIRELNPDGSERALWEYQRSAGKHVKIR